MDAEQEEPKDTESEVSGKASAGAAADISQKKQNESAEEPASEVEKQLPEISDTPQTIYVDICGAVTSPGVYELPYGSRVFQAIEQAGGYVHLRYGHLPDIHSPIRYSEDFLCCIPCSD